MDGSPLSLDAEAMRRTGYATVDLLVERLSDPTIPVIRRATREDMARRLQEPPPEDPIPFEEVLGRLRRDVLPFTSRSDHPGYLAYVPACGTWPGALGDFIASALNVYAGAWMDSAGPTQLELVVVDWFRRWIGYPDRAAGILLNGGSAANMTALACAREALLGAMSDGVVAYASDQAHSSIARAARILGFRPDQLRVLPSDGSHRLRPDVLSEAMAADRRAGRRPLFVAAAAGSTNTGAVDPLADLAEVCRHHGAWLHVDGAYGGFAALTERGRALLAGIEEADSVTLDPHKWLYQPFECGSLLVRDGHLLREAFQVSPDYLEDTAPGSEEVNFSDLGMQLTRMTRALKVWGSIQTFGLAAFREAIDRAMDLALRAQERIEASDHLEVLSPATLGVVCFRRRFPSVEDHDEMARRNAALAAALEGTGEALISSTRLRGRFALRMCILNHTTRWEDVERTLTVLETTSVEEAPEAPGRIEQRHAAVDTTAWGAEVATLASIPLFEGLGDGFLGEVAGASRVTTAGPDESVVRRWDTSRDFYVVLEGTLRVEVDDQVVSELGAGDFFGELAALDWGASFGYPRLASVTATTAVRLLVVPPDRFNGLMRQAPAFADRIRGAVRDRLDR
jgi:aromatic-L-amino-acid/L-tryptophan decarboxylase